MPTIGETLREARMRQRLDIADVEERTKIRAKYLRALENEEFGLLPGPTFVKTFLRTYSEELGLDPHVLVEEYRAGYEPEDETEPQPLGAPPGAPPPRDRRYPGAPPSRPAIIGVVVGVVLLFLLVLGLTGNDDEDENGDQAARTSETERKPARRRQRRKPAATAVNLQVTPTGPVYVCVDNGPGTTEVFEGTIDEPQTFKGKKVRINLGRTAVELRVNGRPFPVRQVANPVGYEFSPTGSKELPEGQRPTCAGVAPT
jgi:cytoskeleton protein RodZ